jgi:hypothetical protein
VRTQRGIATLVAGTVTVAGVRMTATSRILATRNTPGGVIGDLSCDAANRVNGNANSVPQGSFDINSANAGDTSTVDWVIQD